MRRCTLSAAIAASVFLLAGCASTTSSPSTPPGPPPAATIQPRPTSQLVKGMPAGTVRELLGKPALISMLVTSDGMAEEWTYHFSYQRTGQEATNMESRPAYLGLGTGDSNGLSTIQVPAYSVVRYQVDETVKLLLHQGKLIEWKSSVTEKRFYD